MTDYIKRVDGYSSRVAVSRDMRNQSESVYGGAVRRLQFMRTTLAQKWILPMLIGKIASDRELWGLSRPHSPTHPQTTEKMEKNNMFWRIIVNFELKQRRSDFRVL